MYIGVTIGESELTHYRGMFKKNDMMRIFPFKPSGRDGYPPTVKLLPTLKSDARIEYCRQVGAIPFLSTKCDGDDRAIRDTREKLEDISDWLPGDGLVYLTDWHEPEGDKEMTPDRYRKNFREFLYMVDGLPLHVRKRIRCGPVLTKTWLDKSRQRSWTDWDPAAVGAGGDFLGVDMYVSSGTRKGVIKDLPSAAEFTTRFRSYNFDRPGKPDKRPRIWPELGLIGLPYDLDGKIRADWIQEIYDEVSTWHRGAPGWTEKWEFEGFAWWNRVGSVKKKDEEHWIEGIGWRRDFNLDKRTVDEKTVAPLDPPQWPVKTMQKLIEAERERRLHHTGSPHEHPPVRA